mmetsp:Transcript_16984/g.27589  ORF Transcript_16984/g.27589 Transcript_16984/m.27589 type:complete len:215 (-) Transcript_16984:19-663(-)
MTGSELLNIVVTIGVSQLLLDLASNYLVFQGDSYQRSVRNMERCLSKFQRAEVDFQKNANKHGKKYERAKAEYSTACADVARRHMPPNVVSGFFFFLLGRILGTEYKGKVVGVLPFVPTDFFARITCRGLEWRDLVAEKQILLDGTTTMDPKQALSFTVVYVLAGLTVKYYVHKAVAVKPPQGADNGVRTVVDSPMGQSMARALGIDPNDLKMD